MLTQTITGNFKEFLVLILTLLLILFTFFSYARYTKKDLYKKLLFLPITIIGVYAILAQIYAKVFGFPISNYIFVLILFLIAALHRLLLYFIKRFVFTVKNKHILKCIDVHHSYVEKIIYGFKRFKDQPALIAKVFFIDLKLIVVAAFITRLTDWSIYNISKDKFKNMAESSPNINASAALTLDAILITFAAAIIIIVLYLLLKSFTWSLILNIKQKKKFIKKFALTNLSWYAICLVILILISLIAKKDIVIWAIIIASLIIAYITQVMHAVFNYKKSVMQNIRQALKTSLKIKKIMVPFSWSISIILLLTIIFNIIKFHNQNFNIIMYLIALLLFYQLVRYVFVEIYKKDLDNKTDG